MASRQEDVMLLAVPQHPVAGAYVLKLREDERDHMLHLPVWIFDDMVIRESHQYARGATPGSGHGRLASAASADCRDAPAPAWGWIGGCRSRLCAPGGAT